MQHSKSAHTEEASHSSTPVRKDKQHQGATGKNHNFQIPVCQLIYIDAWCEHKEEESPEKGYSHQSTGHGSTGHHPEHLSHSGHHGHSSGVSKVAKLGGSDRRHAHRQKDGKLILDVIPSGPALKQGMYGGGLERGSPIFGSDLITFKAKINSPDCKHPVWTIKGPNSLQSLPGENPYQYKFKSPGFTPADPNLMGFYWKPSLEPDEYTVTCQTCRGKPQEALIRVWPYFKSELNVVTLKDGEAEERGERWTHHSQHLAHSAREKCLEWTKHIAGIRQVVAKAFHLLAEWVPNFPEIEPSFLEGSLKLSNELKEAGEARVVWEGELALEMLLIGIEIKFVLLHANWLPEKVRNYFDTLGVDFEAGVYAKFSGEISIAGKAVWKNEEDAEKKGELTGSVSFSLGADSKLVLGKNVIAADFSGTTKGLAKGEPHITSGPTLNLEYHFEWEPLKIAGYIKLKRKNVWCSGYDIDKDLVSGELTVFETQKSDSHSLQLWPI